MRKRPDCHYILSEGKLEFLKGYQTVLLGIYIQHWCFWEEYFHQLFIRCKKIE